MGVSVSRQEVMSPELEADRTKAGILADLRGSN
jgi:hypothetical protein